MDTERLGSAVVVVLAVLAVSAMAAAVDGTQSGPRLDTDGSGDPGAGGGSGGDAGSDVLPEQRSAETTATFGGAGYLGLALRVLFAGTALALVGMAALLYWRDGREGLLAVVRDVRNFLAAGGIYLLAVALLALGLSHLRMNYEGGEFGTPANPGGSGGDGGAAETATQVGTDVPLAAVVALALAALAVVALVLYRSRIAAAIGGGTDHSEPDRDGDRGEASGAPAATPEPLRDVDETNPVYEAWGQMARAVDRSGLRTSTPMEIAGRAVEEGLDRDAVQTLTAVFEEVRYGDRPATDDRVSRARSALDRLEAVGGDEA